MSIVDSWVSYKHISIWKRPRERLFKLSDFPVLRNFFDEFHMVVVWHPFRKDIVLGILSDDMSKRSFTNAFTHCAHLTTFFIFIPELPSWFIYILNPTFFGGSCFKKVLEILIIFLQLLNYLTLHKFFNFWYFII